MNTIPDVTPGDDEPMEEKHFQYKETDKPPVKKSIFDRIADKLRTDPDIAQQRENQRAIKQKADAEIAEIDMQIAKREADEATRLREADPEYQQRKREAERLLKLRMKEAVRFAALIEICDEHIRRHPPKDQKLLSWCYAQLQNFNLFGLFSRPKE